MTHNKDNSFDSIERGIGSDISEIQRINESKIRTLELELKSLLQFIESLEKTIQELEIRLNVLKSELNSDGLTQLKSRLQKELGQAKRDRLYKIRSVLGCEIEYSNLEINVKLNHEAQLHKPRNLTRQQLNDAYINDSNYIKGKHTTHWKEYVNTREMIKLELGMLKSFDPQEASKLRSQLNFIDNYFNDGENQNGNSIFSKIMRFFS